ncbi:hypothetical protein LLEC1_07687 [Akanthomyces lecanii]|uniref:Uncharacterized protein n=1 Tax=Cordyceps confragosa TaxID=2714763 RepID=A0A179IJK0_CORDF|nr:hypothetical protein LLEC1_07687 [Akanthomyces lecanii]
MVHWASQIALRRQPSVGLPNQDAKRLLRDISGAFFVDIDAPEYSETVAAGLQRILTTKDEGDVAHQVDQFAQESKVEQTFWLLRFAIYLASNNLLTIENAARFLECAQDSNTFWVVDAFLALRTPTTDTFASVLLVGATWLGNYATCCKLLEIVVDPNGTVPASVCRSSTALLEAVRQGNSGLVRLLLDRGAEVNAAAIPLPSPLGIAVLVFNTKATYLEIIQMLFDKGANVHQAPDEDSVTTILNLIIDLGNAEVDELFFQANVAIGSFSKHYLRPLQVAAFNGNMKFVKALLKAGVDVNERADAETLHRAAGKAEWLKRCVQTPLQLALLNGRLAVAAVLLQEGADVNGFDAKECLEALTCRTYNICPLSDSYRCSTLVRALREAHPPLHIAARKRYTALGRLLLKLGARVDSGDDFDTALQVAASQRDNLAFVKLLLDNGADVTAPAAEPRGRTALQAAAESGDGDIIEILLQNRAHINANPSCEGVTALQAAASRGDTLLVSKLLQMGADVNAPAAATNGQTALQAAVKKGCLATIDELLQKGADILAPDTCCVLEAAMGQPLVLEMLLRRLTLADTLSRSFFLFTGSCLTSIEEENFDQITALLLKYEVRPCWSHLQRALQIAVERGSIGLAKKWINAGADVQMCLRGPRGVSIAKAAVATGSQDFCALLFKSREDLAGERGTEALLVAVSNRDLSMLGFLLRIGANPEWDNSCRANRPSPLANVFEPLGPMERGRFSVTRVHHVENMASMLLSHGAQPKGVAFTGEVCGVSLHMLKRLIDSGLDVNQRLARQDSLLQYAANYRTEDVVELLLDAGADVNAPPAPTKGYTALQGAVGKDNVRLVKLLLSRGANVNGPASPEHGATALQRAVLIGSMPIFVLLVQQGADVNAPASSVGGRTALEAAAENGRLDMAFILLQRDKEPETLLIRCKRAAKLAASRGFPILARELRKWKA